MRTTSCLAIALAWLSVSVGCRTPDISTARSIATFVAKFTPNRVEMRKQPATPIKTTLSLLKWKGAEPSEQVQLFLRRHGLLEDYQKSPQDALGKLRLLNDQAPTIEATYVIAELAFLQGEYRQRWNQSTDAKQWFVGAIGHSYQYLFDPNLNDQRSAYTPEFRRVCEIYNKSLEGLLRVAQNDEQFHHGSSLSAATCGTHVDIEINLTGRWEKAQFEKFEFVSDYRTPRIANNYHNYGLGVPLIAVRERTQDHEGVRARVSSDSSEFGEEKYYPPGLALPLTAFFKWEEIQDIPSHQGLRYRATIELIDPLEFSTVKVGHDHVPMESNITTPLVYFLDDPLLQTNVFALFGMIDGQFAQQFEGLYMLEPFDPNKIPVVMVHGLGSSPVTWLEMFNDLRADQTLRDRYQFWFYLYPTGQPFWDSAAQFRQELAELQNHFNPGRKNWSLNQMVLVGHSMGGLVSRMQTVDSGNEFWNVISDQPFERLEGSKEEINELAQQVFFTPDRSIRRVITLATPHRGSDFANSATQWLSHRFFKLPNQLFRSTPELLKRNKDLIRDPEMVAIHTSIDSLAPDSPIFPAMKRARKAPWVRYHNIYGNAPGNEAFSFFGSNTSMESDGVVSVASSRDDTADSQMEVAATHTGVHRHSKAIQEVRRILLVHVGESDAELAFARQQQPLTQPGAINHQHGRRENQHGPAQPIVNPNHWNIQKAGFKSTIGDR